MELKMEDLFGFKSLFGAVISLYRELYPTDVVYFHAVTGK